MSRNIYDNWERLFEAVMRREQYRQLSLESSRSPSIISTDSNFSSSLSSPFEDGYFRPSPSPLHPDAVRLKLRESLRQGKLSGKGKKPTGIRNMWRNLSIFSSYSSKRDYRKEEDDRKWATSQRTFHSLELTKQTELFSAKNSFGRVSQISPEEKATVRAEIARLRELHTLKGHIESVMKLKGIDIESIHHGYTI